MSFQFSESQLACSQALQLFLRDNITAQGPMTFSEYMQHALYHAPLGYYRNGSIKFGATGDFITSPEISRLFSYCLARQCIPVLATCSSPSLLEVGAGSGQLAVDLLNYLEKQQALPDAYYILELSADLQQRQRDLLAQKLPHFIDHVHWITELPAAGFEGVVIANEVLDAMPVNIFFWDKVFGERYVDVVDGKFVWCDGELSSDHLQAALTSLPILKDQRYVSEVNLSIRGWIKSLSGCLSKGIMLLIDYGYARSDYYHAARTAGTLMCHLQHQALEDPFAYVGLQDITAHVDFTAVAEAAVDNNCDVLGYIQQGRFLTNLGIYDLISADSVDQQYTQAQQVKQLVMPNQMGERFKVIAVGKDFTQELQGFAQGDQLYQL
jgi:SAM-dependent MidA family methyltransferase